MNLDYFLPEMITRLVVLYPDLLDEDTVTKIMLVSSQICREHPDNAIGDKPYSSVFSAIMDEVQRATDKFPTWPTDPIHALHVIGEEFGELSKAVLQEVYEPHKNKFGDIRKETIQTAAMCVRFLMSLDRYAYEFSPAASHRQDVIETAKNDDNAEKQERTGAAC